MKKQFLFWDGIIASPEIKIQYAKDRARNNFLFLSEAPGRMKSEGILKVLLTFPSEER